MSEKFKIKLSIANRVYPLTVEPSQEEGLRKAALKIDSMIKQFEQSYSVRDKQDVLAMCALQFASLIEINAINNEQDLIKSTEKMNKMSMIITQNIDGLHQMSGSNSVIELHGSIHKNHCMKCMKMFDAKYIKNTFKCDSCGGVIRPNVVMYEEPIDPFVYDKAKEAIEEADMLIVGGTSLVVYPAAGMLRYFKGDNIVFINKTKTNKNSVASLVINDSIGKTLKQMMESL